MVGGWAKVYRKSWKYPTFCSVSFSEVAKKKKSGELNSNWNGKGATMVNKVAKTRAYRETFVEELGGMYSEEEFGYDSIPIVEDEIIPQGEPIENATPSEAPAEVNINDI